MFASEGIDLGRCLLCMHGVRRVHGNVRAKCVPVQSLLRCFGRDVRGAISQIARVPAFLMGPLSFSGFGGRWACAMTDESAVYSVYAKGIFHI